MSKTWRSPHRTRSTSTKKHGYKREKVDVRTYQKKNK